MHEVMVAAALPGPASPPLGALVYHRPSGQRCIVTAVHRAAQPFTYTVCDHDRAVEHHNVALDELDLRPPRWRGQNLYAL